MHELIERYIRNHFAMYTKQLSHVYTFASRLPPRPSIPTHPALQSNHLILVTSYV